MGRSSKKSNLTLANIPITIPDGKIASHGVERWYKDEQLECRQDLPSIISDVGTPHELHWWTEKESNSSHPFVRGRELEVWASGDEIHREDGPAVIIGERHMWFVHDQRHTFQSFLSTLDLSPEDAVRLKLLYDI